LQKVSVDIFSFLQKQQTLVSLNKHSVDKCSKLQTAPACKPLAASGGREKIDSRETTGIINSAIFKLTLDKIE
jgi:hypothetical protein